MARIFISGSSAGLGLMAGQLLASNGHNVVLHARNAQRAATARREFQQAEAFVVGDLETIAGANDVAAQVNTMGHFDAVIHNAAVGYREAQRVTADALPHLFAINTLSAYILTALIARPKRLVYHPAQLTTFSTQSGLSGHRAAAPPFPLLGVKQTFPFDCFAAANDRCYS
jgi:NAD(P)-dependent dehydrogenase (short-subunit alcohol dehydrogenase family)